ncbi:MAG: stage V sporulation protein AD [Candidatus Borkfalkiaceae bacterium]|nr:stage V sporulation protein AD [Christensenellaceae bacterium]
MGRLIVFKNKPSIISSYTVCGPKEAEGCLAGYIDLKIYDDYDNQPSFELAERKMLTSAIERAVKKSGLKKDEIEAYIGGDLLNQIISSSFTAREFIFPFLGVYNACATMAESMIVGGVLVGGGFMNNVVCATSSHFSTAERQYRFPVEQGTTRPAQSQWTVTGAGANVISSKAGAVKLVSAVLGRVVDYGVADANNMGAAMAPAAADTILDFFKYKNAKPTDYDLIITGDLGALGSRILKDLLLKKGVDISLNHVDCGELIYNMDEEEYQGGSGAGCSAIVFNSYIYKRMLNGEYKNVLLITTGALLSTTSTQQGETIPGIAHLVELLSE